MTHNYPIKQQNEHEHSGLANDDYLVTSDILPTPMTDELLVDVEIDMSRSVYDMRREFHRTIKRLKNHLAEKEPTASIYKFGYTYPTGFHFAKWRVMG